MEWNDWRSYYSKHISLGDAIGSWLYHWPYLLQTLRETRSRALEIGCGRGVHSIFLSYFVPNVVGIDNDAALIMEARKQNAKFHGRAKFFQYNAFDLNLPKVTFDVCFSQGFLEHFKDEEICTLIEKQLCAAKTMVASVPSSFYPTKDRGDERLMPIQDWRRILRDYHTRMFYYGFMPREPRKALSRKNLLDATKILSSKSYKLHLCMIAKKANG